MIGISTHELETPYTGDDILGKRPVHREKRWHLS